mmetsp:Transcript_44472/g.139402  ORF Transcript_44472/g.139402 Transcript_44472/m.139402 type:complete len:302 (+) Transcript_44472:116-1021(+)
MAGPADPSIAAGGGSRSSSPRTLRQPSAAGQMEEPPGCLARPPRRGLRRPLGWPSEVLPASPTTAWPSGPRARSRTNLRGCTGQRHPGPALSRCRSAGWAPGRRPALRLERIGAFPWRGASPSTRSRAPAAGCLVASPGPPRRRPCPQRPRQPTSGPPQPLRCAPPWRRLARPPWAAGSRAAAPAAGPCGRSVGCPTPAPSLSPGRSPGRADPRPSSGCRRFPQLRQHCQSTPCASGTKPWPPQDLACAPHHLLQASWRKSPAVPNCPSPDPRPTPRSSCLCSAVAAGPATGRRAGRAAAA